MKVPKGFLFAAVEAKIKYQDRPDLGLIFSERPAYCAGVFTTNDFQAAPVILGRRRVAAGKARAILVNSGCANACTGEEGLRDAERLTEYLARELKISPEEVLPASTGVIGSRLPVERIASRIPDLVRELTPEKASLVARAMMTTDTFPKIAVRSLESQGRTFTLMGLAKGAGMIAPHMATMLAFLLTDAGLTPSLLQPLLQESVSVTFNRITVDGDTSTNDTVYLLANGASGELDQTEQAKFGQILQEVCQELAYLIVKDGEGATKVVRLRVEGARDTEEALRLARAVADSPLVKTALFGEDPNWGRILVAMGKLGLGLPLEKISVYLEDIPLVSKGSGTPYEEAAQAAMRRPEFTLRIELGLGKASAEILTCDLSTEYVKINAEYRT